jgi:putative ABC transport system substrate-binding protein
LRRRRFLAAAALAAALSRARAQPRPKRLAVLFPYLEQPMSAESKAQYAKALEQHGFRVGENLEILWYQYPLRDLAGKAEEYIAQIAAARPDCVYAGREEDIRRIQAAAPTLPIVATFETEDPVERGFAASLQRPGGSVTGVHGGVREVLAKRIELLKAFVPGLKRVAWIAFPGQLSWFPAFENAAREAGLTTRQVLIQRTDDPKMADLRRDLARLRREGCAGGHFHSAIPEAIAAVTQAALEHKLAISYSGDYARWKTEGLLFIYNSNSRRRGEALRTLAVATIARILRGERPGDIAFEGPTGYYLHVNAKTAARIGVVIPPHVTVMANEIAQ